MKNYEITKENYLEKKEEVIKDLNNLLVGTKITRCSNNEEGIILNVEIGDWLKVETSLQATSKVGNATFNLFFALDKKSIQLEVNVDDYKDIVDQLKKAELAAIKEVEIKKEKERQERIKKEKEEELKKKREIKLLARKQNVIKSFKELRKTSIKLDNDTYTCLGWLANNVSSIHATIPEYLQSYFESEFGLDAPKLVVDSGRKTSGGYDMQWNFSFSLRVKNIETAPLLIKQLFNDKKELRNVEYIYDLVKNYGFKFGKKQDLDSILDNIPSDKLSQFKAGLTA